jgi:hypothetical protein
MEGVMGQGFGGWEVNLIDPSMLRILIPLVRPPAWPRHSNVSLVDTTGAVRAFVIGVAIAPTRSVRAAIACHR